ncbi:unnamed protein product, partial [Scytosiphon promiscuus]
MRRRNHQKEMRVNIEQKIIATLAPDYDKLPPLNKLEVFQRSMSQTDGQDLARVLWLKS